MRDYSERPSTNKKGANMRFAPMWSNENSSRRRQWSTTKTRSDIGFRVGISRLNRRRSALLFFDHVAHRGTSEIVASHDAIDVVGIERLVLEQRLGHGFDLVAIGLQKLAGYLEKRGPEGLLHLV